MSANMSMAAAVAEVNMIVNDSPNKGTSSYDGALELLKNVDIVHDPYRAEFKALVEKLKGYDK